MTRLRKKPGVEVPVKEEEERAALGCVLQAGLSSIPETDALLEQLTSQLFFVEDHKLVLDSMRKLRADKHAVDVVTVVSELQRNSDLEAKRKDSLRALVGGLPEAAPSWHNFPSYLATLQEAALKRWTLAKRDKLTALAGSDSLTVDQLREEFDELSEKVHRIGRTKGPVVRALKMSEHLKYVPTEDLNLVGENDIQKGYQGITIIAGPPGTGKSLVATSLAIAGAIGHGNWMGRKVHRQFKTLIIQCENGERRLLKEFQAMKKHHPKIDFDSFIRVTAPPEGGLPFHRPDFRSGIGRIVDDFHPDMMIVDPWTAVAAEDSSKDVIEKLAEMRSMLPPGDACPGMVIVAHPKKPRAEDKGSRGRSLMYTISGSQSLVSSSRCVYVLLPFTDDIQDDRVMWCCSKLSDSEDDPPPDTVWHRRFGTLFEHCDANPKDYWDEDKRSDGPWLTLQMLQTALGKSLMTQTRLATKLADDYNKGKGASSVHKWLKRPEFAQHLEENDGFLRWKD
jgi:hypothetical protein